MQLGNIEKIHWVRAVMQVERGLDPSILKPILGGFGNKKPVSDFLTGHRNYLFSSWSDVETWNGYRVTRGSGNGS